MTKETKGTRQEVLLAAAVMSALVQRQQSHEGLPRIEDISSLLFKLRNAGVDLGEISLRRIPGGGFYSEDIEALIGHYLAAGFADQRSPVTLTEKGRQALTEIITTEREENPSAIKQLEEVLGNLAA
jgi:hypothetical protein